MIPSIPMNLKPQASKTASQSTPQQPPSVLLLCKPQRRLNRGQSAYLNRRSLSLPSRITFMKRSVSRYLERWEVKSLHAAKHACQWSSHMQGSRMEVLPSYYPQANLKQEKERKCSLQWDISNHYVEPTFCGSLSILSPILMLAPSSCSSPCSFPARGWIASQTFQLWMIQV